MDYNRNQKRPDREYPDASEEIKAIAEREGRTA